MHICTNVVSMSAGLLGTYMLASEENLPYERHPNKFSDFSTGFTTQQRSLKFKHLMYLVI